MRSLFASVTAYVPSLGWGPDLFGPTRVHARVPVSSAQRSSYTGPGFPPGGVREGLGLSNTRLRLAQLYGPGGRLELTGAAGGGAVAAVIVPHRTTHPGPGAGGGDGGFGEAEGLGGGGEDFGAAGVDGPVGDIGGGEAQAGEPGVAPGAEVGAEEGGDAGGEGHFEAVVADAPGHGVAAVGEEATGGVEEAPRFATTTVASTRP